MSTTFVQESVDKHLEKGSCYSHTNNPNIAVLEEKVVPIENSYGLICVRTGVSATTLCINAFMKASDHCVITNCSCGGTNCICREQFIPLGMEFSFVDFTNPAIVEAATKPNMKLIFSESPTNPTLALADLSAISEIAKSKGILYVCDSSTFVTPHIMRPLNHGCDLTIQSLTKCHDGLNVGLGGALVAANEELYNHIKLVQNMHGNLVTPMMAFLMLQTMKSVSNKSPHWP